LPGKSFAAVCCYVKLRGMENELLQRITMNPKVCFGKPTIRNMRYPVEMILDLLSAGMSFDEILDDYPDLEKDDLRACLSFAGKLVKVNSIQNVLAA
jgi:uncharacterized protein (DUF433 family)